MNLFDRLKSKKVAVLACETCRGPLRRNNAEQSLRFCRPGCRRLRERKGRKRA